MRGLFFRQTEREREREREREKEREREEKNLFLAAISSAKNQ